MKLVQSNGGTSSYSRTMEMHCSARRCAQLEPDDSLTCYDQAHHRCSLPNHRMIRIVAPSARTSTAHLPLPQTGPPKSLEHAKPSLKPTGAGSVPSITSHWRSRSLEHPCKLCNNCQTWSLSEIYMAAYSHSWLLYKPSFAVIWTSGGTNSTSDSQNSSTLL